MVGSAASLYVASAVTQKKQCANCFRIFVPQIIGHRQERLISRFKTRKKVSNQLQVVSYLALGITVGHGPAGFSNNNDAPRGQTTPRNLGAWL